MTGGRTILLLFFLLLSAMGAEGQNLVVVSKWNQRLVVQNPQGDTLLSCRVGLGSNIGQKRMEGDRRTPEGIFPIVEIQDASQWRHDFGDGHGLRRGAYGAWFIRLAVEGFTGIGLHGTCFPESIGTLSSEGCVRLLDSDLEALVRLVHKDDLVVIIDN
ncbi:MAG: L,D-transpeptidase [Bacteroidales bacterium]|nr:L,D-transpeptidase [Bacteroidales bacterium]